MQYRQLGRSGLQVSVLSLGSWVTFAGENREAAAECLSVAKDAGVNFFDNAEAYANGDSERMMGAAFRELDWKRHEYIVSTKFFSGLHDVPNMRSTLNRKNLVQAIEDSLERLGLDFVDLVFCHRPDPDTPIEETVVAMSEMIERGQALYWGTSEWRADEIRAAWDIADRHDLNKPVAEQPQYNLLFRKRVETEYARLYDEIGLGITVWSPLKSGLLTGKYQNGVPVGSRATLPGYEWIVPILTSPAHAEKVDKLLAISADLGVPLSKLALAWCTKNPHVSTVITGASSARQVRENLAALEILDLLTDEVMQQIDIVTTE
ncbi:MAG: aldo/keto reductase [Acidimicrobiales bacterium]